MNFIEDAILPRSSDSLGKECNTAFKTSQGGSKTTFLPIKLQQSIIQAAMYAATANAASAGEPPTAAYGTASQAPQGIVGQGSGTAKESVILEIHYPKSPKVVSAVSRTGVHGEVLP